MNVECMEPTGMQMLIRMTSLGFPTRTAGIQLNGSGGEKYGGSLIKVFSDSLVHLNIPFIYFIFSHTCLSPCLHKLLTNGALEAVKVYCRFIGRP